MIARVGSALFVLLLAASAFGYRREYFVTLDGSRKPGSEVCFFRGEPAGDAFSLFFSYKSVACLPADDVLDFPPGLFHAFARHRDGYVSAHRDYFIYTGEPAPERGYEHLEIPLAKAGVADVSQVSARLRSGQSIGLWIAPTETAGGTFFPLVDGESTILVPAATPFVPLLIENQMPVAVGEPLQLGAGERRAISPFFSVKDRADVVSWLKLDASSAGEGETRPEPPLPEITLAVDGQTFSPSFPLRNSKSATHTLVLFRRIPVGAAQLRVRGRTWIHTNMELTVTAPTTVVKEPVRLVPAAALDVSWNLGGASADEDCSAESLHHPRIEAELSQCRTSVVEGTQKTTCKPVERESQAFLSTGSMSFDGVLAGEYRLTVQPPFSKAVTMPVSLEAGRESSVTAPLEAFRFFGTVTLNGSPVAARIIFASGEARSDQAGMYTAAVAANPLTNLIRVVLCGDGRRFTFIPEKAIAANAPYDIKLRPRTLEVSIVGERGKKVPGAEVFFAPVIEDRPNARHYGSTPQTTDADGRTIFSDVPPDKAVTLCASHEAYPRRCTEPISASRVATGKAVVQLGMFTLRGRIAGHSGRGMLAWVDPNGRITEQMRIGPDGKFGLEKPHTPLEHVVYTSERLPLTVLPWENEGGPDAEVVLTLPRIAPRSFTVAVPGMTTQVGFVGIWIDGRYVPLEVLQVHQESRGIDVLIHRGRPITIVDVAETGPITVAYGPLEPAPFFTDIFTVPPYSGVERHRVMGAIVTITP